MKRIAGFWPEVQYVVDVLTEAGFCQVIVSLANVPFCGDWNDEANDVSVGCLWSDRQLVMYCKEAQDWDNAVVVQTTDEQRQLIDERLNIYLKDSPWNWLLEPPPDSDT